MRALVAVSGLALGASSLVLVSTPAHAAGAVDINILATNDFHGRIKSNGVEAGAAVLAGAVKQIRGEHPNTVFAAAGDLIGASTFESFINNDKPTIDALNEAGLEVSAVGNHEFDKGYDDLVDRVMAPESATNPDGGASWKYIGANVVMKDSGDPALDPTFVKDMGGVQVGFVGAVTEHLPELVSPGGIADIKVTDIPTAVNTEADALKAEGVDVIVLLVHEGAASTDCATMDDDPTSDFGSIISGVDDNVDAIVSGHTHLAYNCKFPVAGWAGRPVTERPVVSAGQYGYNLNQLDLSVDPTSGQIQSVDQSILSLTTASTTGTPPVTTYTPNYPADPATKSIVDAAVAEADVKGAVPLGDIDGAFKRAARPKAADPTTTEENRGGESTLGNLVAEVQRWATESETTGSAQIAFMNPGGLRADMVGNTPGSYPTTLTYKQAANVQPFANTLVNMDLTGAQLKTVLEQQWQPAGSSRPFLRLGVSKGFTYTYDPTTKTVTGMWLNGDPIKPGASYSVTVNSFLSTGGDNFFAFADGTHKQDTGKTDLQGMVDYLAEFAADKPLPVDYSQRAVGVTFPSGAPASYAAGDTVAFELSSLAMSGAGDVQDSEVTVSLGATKLGTFPVDNAVAAGATDDEAGTASVSFTLPSGIAGGSRDLTVTGADTGTEVAVPLQVAQAGSTVSAKVTPKRIVVDKTRAKVKISVTSAGTASGKVEVKVGGRTYSAKLHDGKATVTLKKFGSTGTKKVKVTYLGNAATKSSHDSVTIKVVKK
ncbi:bifunctional UDP-sugar hydrolase/5'-nucleotidase [Nocardioides sp. CN2-186]|uniref:bifunctional metallophosphatase/5'-nucleotidase n=1 Tax=Nocardioides tweenelious TaxID=3156607 RepID=UPI0032B3499B